MRFNNQFRLPFVAFKKVVDKLFFLTERNRLANVNLETGPNCLVHHSSILSTIGNGVIKFCGDNYIGRNVEIGTDSAVVISRGASIQDRCIILGDVEIGAYCVFAPNVYISSGRHYYNYIPEYYIQDQDKLVQQDDNMRETHSKKVIIGDDCWIGINAVIMSGITIGKGCVIGANSVVTKDIAPYTIAAGMPARPINKRIDFIPKKQLSYNIDVDLPYFYKGFFTDKLNLDIDKPKGGIAVSDNFIICADPVHSKQLKIRIKKNTPSALSLNYNSQVVLVNNDGFLDVSFDIMQGEYHEIVVKYDDDKDEKIGKVAYVSNVSVQ